MVPVSAAGKNTGSHSKTETDFPVIKKSRREAGFLEVGGIEPPSECAGRERLPVYRYEVFVGIR